MCGRHLWMSPHCPLAAFPRPRRSRRRDRPRPLLACRPRLIMDAGPFLERDWMKFMPLFYHRYERYDGTAFNISAMGDYYNQIVPNRMNLCDVKMLSWNVEPTIKASQYRRTIHLHLHTFWWHVMQLGHGTMNVINSWSFLHISGLWWELSEKWKWKRMRREGGEFT